MKVEVDFFQIKSYNNSQQNAFEELICQLARAEEIKGQKQFIRLGTPDGGVEAYWVLDNEEEYGWQAKYFNSVKDTQWNEIEKSFKTALEKHTKLSKYYICIPLDRADPRIENTKHFMDKWNEKVKLWETYAKSKGREIEFIYWGSSELLDRLSNERHRGRIKFWFDKDELTDVWFKQALENSINSLGPRYSKELNFDVDIAKDFMGLARDKNFKFEFDRYIDEFLISIKDGLKKLNAHKINNKDAIEKCVEKIYSFYLDYINDISFMSEMKYIPFEVALQVLEEVRQNLDLIRDILSKSEGLIDDNEIYGIVNRIDNAIYNFDTFLQSNMVKLVNNNCMIVVGEAGVGKSHLLADISCIKQRENKSGILLLGQHFLGDSIPWTQILREILKLNMNVSEFLSALNAKAETYGERMLLIIDAINEGNGKKIWDNNLYGFIEEVKKYKWLGLVISVRKSYEELLLPKNIIDDNIAIRIEHFGFKDHEYEASKSFFDKYDIQQPKIPLFHPEFQNPLFLKIFCEGLRNSNLSEIPAGIEGIKGIVDFYLKSINKKLSASNILDYDENINVVNKVVEKFIEKTLSTNRLYIEYLEASAIINKEAENYVEKWRDYFKNLVSEGVFTKDNVYINGENREVAYFAYERFEDHILTEYILEKYIDGENVKEAFKTHNYIGEIIKDLKSCYRNKGIIEAMSVQLPEKYNCELYELLEEDKINHIIIESFIESLIWRRKNSISNSCVEFINKYVCTNRTTHNKFLDIVISIAATPDHPFNSLWIHKNLYNQSLGKRDSWWTAYINDAYDNYEISSIRRIIDWTWSIEDRSYLSNESVELLGIILSWFLTASNRYLRDAATKALIRIYENRIDLLVSLMQRFDNVNDPYVYERLFAVAYGCAVHTNDKNSLGELSEFVYNNIFNKEIVYPHILLRDYARGVIEYTLYNGIELNIDLGKIIPPYKSEWIKGIPCKEEMSKYKENSYEIYSSMQTAHSSYSYGDFGRYVFQRALSDWNGVNCEELSRWAIKNIFDLGYTNQIYEKYDKNCNYKYYAGRSGSKKERIGKKYQWISFYDILARVSDKYKIEDQNNWTSNKYKNYVGPWEPYVRDLDPTILYNENEKHKLKFPYIHQIKYDSWDKQDKRWVECTEDLIKIEDMILHIDDEGELWIALSMYPSWSEPRKLGEDKFNYDYKYINYRINSFLVNKRDLDNAFKRFKSKNLFDNNRLDMKSAYSLFNREYFGSIAYKDAIDRYYDFSDWQDLKDSHGKEICKICNTAFNFIWEEEYDCSKKEAITLLKPTKFIFDKIGLKYGKQDGTLINSQGQVICFDPSIDKRNVSSLWIKEKELRRFLDEENLEIIWRIDGEKIDSEERTLYGQRLNIYGAYILTKLKLKGCLKTYKE